jgi:hypothetical protein
MKKDFEQKIGEETWPYDLYGQVDEPVLCRKTSRIAKKARSAG